MLPAPTQPRDNIQTLPAAGVVNELWRNTTAAISFNNCLQTFRRKIVYPNLSVAQFIYDIQNKYIK